MCNLIKIKNGLRVKVTRLVAAKLFKLTAFPVIHPHLMITDVQFEIRRLSIWLNVNISTTILLLSPSSHSQAVGQPNTALIG